MLSDQLKNIRTQKGYSQEVLAEKSGLSVRTIQRVENGETHVVLPAHKSDSVIFYILRLIRTSDLIIIAPAAARQT